MSLGYRRYDEALEYLAALRRDFPRHPEYPRLAAVAELGAGRPGDALRTALRAYRMNPRSRIAGVTVADCLLRAGRETEAAAWYRAALAVGDSPGGEEPDGEAPAELGDPALGERREAILSLLGLI
jgi:predicted Zn-dependent protease